MPGNASDPVKLDHYQNIVSVGWRRTIEYIIIRTGLRRTAASSTPVGGNYSGAGIPLLGGSNDYYSGRLASCTYDYAPQFVATGFFIDDTGTENGQWLGGDQALLSLSSVLPIADPVADGFASGLGSDLEIDDILVNSGLGTPVWLATGAAIGPAVDVPGLGITFYAGTPVLQTPCALLTGALDDYNPSFPTPQGSFPQTRPTDGTATQAGNANPTPASIVYDGVPFTVIGVNLTNFQVTALGNVARFLCRRVN